MSDNVFSIARAAIAAAKPSADGSAVDAVFRAMHGFYGQLWLSKFATGQVDRDGADTGVYNAKAIWAHGIREFDLRTVKTALRQCLDRHPEFPPSLPQFVALCKANAPREVYRPKLPMSGSLVAKRNKEAREKLRKMRAELRSAQAPEEGLPTLLAAVADAARCAGADESKELVRLSRLVEWPTPKVAS